MSPKGPPIAFEEHDLGFLARPAHTPIDASGRGVPGVVLIHDVWGLRDHPRDLARRLAAEGFAVIAVNLYRREGEPVIEDAGAWLRALSDPQVLGDVAACAAELAARPETAGRRVGVVGFCMGGTYALLAACGTPGIAAAVPFYGLLSHAHGLLHDPSGLDPVRKPREPLAAARSLACPLLAFFGGRDAFVPLADVEALRSRVAESGQPAEIVVYPDAGHAFMNDTRPDAYRKRDAREAWDRMREFLEHHL